MARLVMVANLATTVSVLVAFNVLFANFPPTLPEVWIALAFLWLVDARLCCRVVVIISERSFHIHSDTSTAFQVQHTDMDQ